MLVGRHSSLQGDLGSEAKGARPGPTVWQSCPIAPQWGQILSSDSSPHFAYCTEARTESDQSVCVYIKILHIHGYGEGQAGRQVGRRQQRESSRKF